MKNITFNNKKECIICVKKGYRTENFHFISFLDVFSNYSSYTNFDNTMYDICEFLINSDNVEYFDKYINLKIDCIEYHKAKILYHILSNKKNKFYKYIESLAQKSPNELITSLLQFFCKSGDIGLFIYLIKCKPQAFPCCIDVGSLAISYILDIDISCTSIDNLLFWCFINDNNENNIIKIIDHITQKNINYNIETHVFEKLIRKFLQKEENKLCYLQHIIPKFINFDKFDCMQIYFEMIKLEKFDILNHIDKLTNYKLYNNSVITRLISNISQIKFSKNMIEYLFIIEDNTFNFDFTKIILKIIIQKDENLLEYIISKRGIEHFIIDEKQKNNIMRTVNLFGSNKIKDIFSIYK